MSVINKQKGNRGAKKCKVGIGRTTTLYVFLEGGGGGGFSEFQVTGMIEGLFGV